LHPDAFVVLCPTDLGVGFCWVTALVVAKVDALRL